MFPYIFWVVINSDFWLLENQNKDFYTSIGCPFQSFIKPCTASFKGLGSFEQEVRCNAPSCYTNFMFRLFNLIMKIGKITLTVVVKFGPIIFSGRTETFEFDFVKVRNIQLNPIESEAEL